MTQMDIYQPTGAGAGAPVCGGLNITQQDISLNCCSNFTIPFSKASPVDEAHSSVHPWLLSVNSNAADMSWFNNICRNFASMSQDVDGVLNHESIKYIERKVHNVGENVVKFYSKVAEVIVSPIMDPNYISEEEEEEEEEEEGEEAVISYFKSLLGIDEEYFDDHYLIDMPMPTDIEHDAFEQNQSESGFGDSASDVTSTTSSYKETLFSSSTYIQDPFDVAPSSETSPNEIGSYMLPNKAFAVYYGALYNDEIDKIKGNYDCISSHIDSDENYSSSLVSSIDSFESLEDYSSCESTDFNEEANDLSDQEEVEDNCVIVDYNTIPHDDVSSERPNQPSFKRTILNALLSKKRLAMKYKELAISKGHNATKCCQGTSLAAPNTMLLGDSDETIQSSDSEWELL